MRHTYIRWSRRGPTVVVALVVTVPRWWDSRLSHGGRVATVVAAVVGLGNGGHVGLHGPAAVVTGGHSGRVGHGVTPWRSCCTLFVVGAMLVALVVAGAVVRAMVVALERLAAVVRRLPVGVRDDGGDRGGGCSRARRWCSRADGAAGRARRDGAAAPMQSMVQRSRADGAAVPIVQPRRCNRWCSAAAPMVQPCRWCSRADSAAAPMQSMVQPRRCNRWCSRADAIDGAAAPMVQPCR